MSTPGVRLVINGMEDAIELALVIPPWSTDDADWCRTAAEVAQAVHDMQTGANPISGLASMTGGMAQAALGDGEPVQSGGPLPPPPQIAMLQAMAKALDTARPKLIPYVDARTWQPGWLTGPGVQGVVAVQAIQLGDMPEGFRLPPERPPAMIVPLPVSEGAA